MYCRQCNYNLKGSDGPTCPECGLAFDPNDAHSYRRAPRRLGHYKRVLIALMLSILAGGGGLFYVTRPQIVCGDNFGGRTLEFHHPQAAQPQVLQQRLNGQAFANKIQSATTAHPAFKREFTQHGSRFRVWASGQKLFVDYHVPLYTVRDFDVVTMSTSSGQTTPETRQKNQKVESTIKQLIETEITALP